MTEAIKTAIPPNGGPTSDRPWDGPANTARLSNDAGAATYRKAFAWIDPQADPDTKSAYAFIHHEVSADGSVGAANLAACSAGIGILNGGRGASSSARWWDDRAGIYRHLAGHLRDGNQDAPELKGMRGMIEPLKRTGRDTVAGLAIPFGGPIKGRDLTGTYFDKDTDLCIEWFGEAGRPLLYDHGLDGAIRADVVGRQVGMDYLDSGVWAESELDKAKAYRKEIDKLLEAEALSYSSGSMAHLIRANRSTGAIRRWPWVELSMTPEPANPDENVIVHYVKSVDAAARFDEIGYPFSPAVRSLLAEFEEREDLPDGSTYADEGERVLLAVRRFMDRSVDLVSLRSGRVLSAANRSRLAELRDRIKKSSEDYQSALADLEDLLDATDPAAVEAARRAPLEALAAAIQADDVRRFGPLP